jgi:hypothetical protein
MLRRSIKSAADADRVQAERREVLSPTSGAPHRFALLSLVIYSCIALLCYPWDL